MNDRGVNEPVQRTIDGLRDAHALSKLVGTCPVFLRAIQPVRAMAREDVAVVISGETGTGKELVARALHYAGPRARHPFVAVNCGSLPDTLLEDELFGHERGAFTDARAARAGLLTQAERGTVFLDEIDSLTPRAQVALLRVLQDKTFRALGSFREQRADVRFVAATNRPLRELVAGGAFRSDLFYRLSVLTISLPPLRERRDDILLLARHFLAKHARENEAPRELSPEAEHVLLAYHWPGNLRELENVVVRAQALGTGRRLGPSDLGLELASDTQSSPAPSRASDAAVELLTFRDAKRAAVDAFEVDYLTRLLRSHSGNVSSAARAAQKERNDLRRLLKKHCLDRSGVFADERGGEDAADVEIVDPT